jgi:uncharacterized protein YkwD
VLLVTILAASASAAPPARYNDSLAPPPLNPIAVRVEALVAEVAAAERREVPRPEPRLTWATQAIAERVPETGPPSNELVEAALRLYGIVEPPPHLIIVSMTKGGQNELIDELRLQLPRALKQGRYRRVAVATADDHDRTHVIVALQETFLELAAIPRALPAGAEVLLRGRLLPPFQRPEAFVTGPDGQVAPLELGRDPSRFAVSFRCGPKPGRYQVELTGEDRYGTTVLGNFPLACGQRAPTSIEVRRSVPEESFTDAASAEAALRRLFDRDRQRAGLPLLEHDPALAKVARDHSIDMHEHGFVGHVSPITGSASDRVRRAKLDAQLILENVARAYSPGEAEEGLMNSPGHRANILNREVTRVGIGTVVSEAPGGSRELLVTQVFTRPFDTIDARTPGELRRKIDALRAQHGLAPLSADVELDRVAQKTAEQMAAGKYTSQQAAAPLDRELSRFGDRYSAVRSLFAVAHGISQVAGSLGEPLGDPHVSTLGMGLSVRPSSQGPADLYVVLILATRRHAVPPPR